jgi:glycosyltransferase involved in cell wall biosynthesis
MSKVPFVVYWNNIPSPYMVERFNALSKCAPFYFEAWFNDRSKLDRSWIIDESTWNFAYRYMPRLPVNRSALHFPTACFGRRPDALVSLYAQPSFVFGLLAAKVRGAKVGIWVEVTFDSWVPRAAWKERVKKSLFPMMDAIITVGEDGKAFAKRYGASDERIYFAPHVIDVPYFEHSARNHALDRDEIRSGLGLRGTVFLYVGRLWYGKGVRELLTAFESLQRSQSDEVSLLFVGDGPQDGELRHSCRSRDIRNVVFAGFIQKQDIPRYYAVADVFVFPTLGDPYGLVVDEAMASALPVISTTAAGEIGGRIQDGVNGYIVPAADPTALAARMQTLAESAHLRERMGKLALKGMQGRTPAQWAEKFQAIVESMLRDPT